MSPLNVARRGLGCTVCNGRLYAVGGWNSQVVEEYDFETNKWKEFAPLTKDRWLCKLFTIKTDWVFGDDEVQTNKEK